MAPKKSEGNETGNRSDIPSEGKPLLESQESSPTTCAPYGSDGGNNSRGVGLPPMPRTIPKPARARRSSSVPSYGSQTANELLNVDPATLQRPDQRASFGGCMVDLGELTSVLAVSEKGGDDKQETREASLSSSLGDSASSSVRRGAATYWKLFRHNAPFTLYVLSFFAAHGGEWFTYVAQLTTVERLSGSQTAVSILVAIRMIPNIVCSTFGGALADALDRRVSMIVLDVVGAGVVLLYLVVLRFESLPLLYLVALIQATVAAIYDPVRQAILPLLVPEEEYLKKATTIAGLAWSVMAAVGSSLGGAVASVFGVRTCFLVDSLTYVLSAALMWMVGGEWTVADDVSKAQRRASLSPAKLMDTYKSMTVEGVKYLTSSSLGALIFVKASGALTFGSIDVLNVRLSHVEGDEASDSKRLGILFACMGLGCLLGPLVVEKCVDMKRPRTLLAACLFGYATIAVGFAGISISSTFGIVCISTVVRGFGSSVMWVNSTLLLQKFAVREMLGRVLSVDFGICTLISALSAFVAGWLEDHASMTPEHVCVIMSYVGLAVLAIWIGLYRFYFGEQSLLGAEHFSSSSRRRKKQFNNPSTQHTSSMEVRGSTI